MVYVYKIVTSYRDLLQNVSKSFSLDDTAIIIISTTSTVAAVLFVLAVTSYYFRRKDIKWKRKSTRPHERTIYYTSNGPPIIPVVYPSDNKQQQNHNSHNRSQSYGTTYVGHPGNSTRDPPPVSSTRHPIFTTKLSRSRVPRYCQYNSYPGGVRIIRVHHRTVNTRDPRPVMIYKPTVKPMYTQIRQPSTVPPLRLNNYKPKIIAGHLSPCNIREHSRMDNNVTYDSNSSQDYSTEIVAPSHRWYPSYNRKNYITNAGKQDQHHFEGGRLKRDFIARTKAMMAHQPQSILENNENHHSTNVTTELIPDDYVIVDYLVDKEEFESVEGPMSTSTPRTPDLDITHDTEDVSYERYIDVLHKRQRLPHQGSIDKIPLLY